ncbi:MAG: porphobilinogen synthase [Bdellovibrio sp.]|nr:MAG: porphobilinogen synthase [Bdellovibrio sp.]
MTFNPRQLARRPRRNRRSVSLREMVAETDLRCSNLVWPLFILPTESGRQEIATLPGQSRWGWRDAIEEMKLAFDLGIPGFALFPVIPEDEKDPVASQATNAKHPYLRILREMRRALPGAVLVTDIALDPFSSEGHDGLVKDGRILNDETLEVLARMALLHAETGIDMVAPSDMMDGRVAAIRQTLDQAGFMETGILAYAAKYASSFYGPFRDALGSAPRFGDKKTYQMDFRNGREAGLEARLDVEEGADIVMVKPGLPYLDIVARLKAAVQVPVAVYNVSGEYAMIKLAAKAGALNEKNAVMETLTAFRRAGADIIFTYHALDAANWLKN